MSLSGLIADEKLEKESKKPCIRISTRIQGTFTRLFYTAVYKITSLLSLHCTLKTAMSAACSIISEQAAEINPSGSREPSMWQCPR
jgi:hypothetical protein